MSIALWIEKCTIFMTCNCGMAGFSFPCVAPSVPAHGFFRSAIPINSVLFTNQEKLIPMIIYLRHFTILRTVASAFGLTVEDLCWQIDIVFGVSTWCMAFVIERKEMPFFFLLLLLFRCMKTSFEDASTIQRHRHQWGLELNGEIQLAFSLRDHSIFNAVSIASNTSAYLLNQHTPNKIHFTNANCAPHSRNKFYCWSFLALGTGMEWSRTLLLQSHIDSSYWARLSMNSMLCAYAIC